MFRLWMWQPRECALQTSNYREFHWSQAPAAVLWTPHWVGAEAALPMSRFQLVTEYSRNTEAGLYLSVTKSLCRPTLTQRFSDSLADPSVDKRESGPLPPHFPSFLLYTDSSVLHGLMVLPVFPVSSPFSLKDASIMFNPVLVSWRTWTNTLDMGKKSSWK